ncbi:MAG: PKD domain-containing protein [Flavobacteriales bacterium]|jgi:PKD repeat protein|nr:PKD domain-containing protein [Flavobacteriales bacterium]MCI1751891.1 PKD domain-containing protein [Flavobacteriales bacterium]
MNTRPRLLMHVLAIGIALAASPARAQVPCAATDTTFFSFQDQGGYNYQFTPEPPPGWTMQYQEWAFGGADWNDFSLYPQASVLFPGAGDYLICLRATQEDYFGNQCVSIYCALLNVPVDSACAGLNAGFTIESQSGGIQFNNLTTSVIPEPTTMMWDFGDGSTSDEVSPLHTYPGAGPYKACLTVISGNCTATACNWIYLGPPDVSCDTLLQPAIGVIQYERTIAVFDQSVTSGMNSSINWDFGDGAQATGSPVLHTYADDGDYQVCGNIGLWGPLTPDTCMGSACKMVFTFPVTGVNDLGKPASPKVYPVPFTHHFTVEMGRVDEHAHWVLEDLLGRRRMRGVIPTLGTFDVSGERLAPGVYLLRMFSGLQSKVVTVVKSNE